MSDFVTIKFKLITDVGLVFYPQTVKIVYHNQYSNVLIRSTNKWLIFSQTSSQIPTLLCNIPQPFFDLT